MSTDFAALEVVMPSDPPEIARVESRIAEIEAEHRRTVEPRNRKALELRLKRFRERLKGLQGLQPLAS